MRIELPEKVEGIIQTLMQAGYEAYAVGGCVRDSLLGKEPKDWDITIGKTGRSQASVSKNDRYRYLTWDSDSHVRT